MKEDNIDITDKDDLKDFKIEGSCYVNDKFIGTAVAKKITVNICDNGKYNLEDKEISVKTGIDIDGNVEYVPMGNYIIEKPTTQEVTSQTQFVGYDYMVKFNITYENRVTYPIKASDLLKDVCEQVGVECGSVEFVNSDYLILGNPFTNNEDCKTVLSNIAQLAGGFANIGRDNKVYIKTLTTINDLLRVKDVHFMSVKELNFSMVNKVAGISDVANDNIDGDNYFEFSRNNKFGKVNSLILRISGTEGENTTIQDEESIKENGLTELTIEDNYFLINQTEREKVIKQLWNNLKGLEYLPFEAKYYGYPYLDLGDMLCIKDTDDKEYVSYVFDYTFEYNGIYNGTLKTEAMTKTQTAYKNTNDVKTKFKNTERKIDKIKGIIEDIIEETSENTEKISQHEQTIDSITDTVSSVEKKLENDYYTKTETNSQIQTKADSITTSVTKQISTAKSEAINSANASTDTKLKDYTVTSKLGTFIEQNYEHIKVAWNQISEFIQMMIINNNASLAILDENKNVMMALDKKGQHFYKSDGTAVFGEMGVQTVDDKNYISFSVEGDYDKDVADGMAWGIKTTSDNNFYPILYLKNFSMGPKNSDAFYGELVLSACNLVLDGLGAGIETGNINIYGDPRWKNFIFYRYCK